ncbi:MAG: hypothetical protein WCG85_04940 [Polyangia bacterium]
MPVDIAEKTRSKGRPFQKGNPGRPKGSRNKTTLACLDLLDGEGEALTRVAIQRAKDGDPVALRLVIDRVIPRGRGRTASLDLPAIREAGDLVNAYGVVIDSAAHGELTLGEAEAFVRILDGQRRAIETQDLAIRLELLEKTAKEFRR